MLYFKDNKDGYYQFDDNAPKEWYANLIACNKQIDKPKSADQLQAETEAVKAEQLATIVVTTQSGKIFDGTKLQELICYLKLLPQSF